MACVTLGVLVIEATIGIYSSALASSRIKLELNGGHYEVKADQVITPNCWANAAIIESTASESLIWSPVKELRKKEKKRNLLFCCFGVIASRLSRKIKL